MSFVAKTRTSLLPAIFRVRMYSGEPGSGAGKGGGSGGITFGKSQTAREDEYFFKDQKQLLGNLKEHLNKEITFHQEQKKRHDDAIRRHKELLADIKE